MVFADSKHVQANLIGLRVTWVMHEDWNPGR
jgi:hypothetical protein